MKVVLAVSLAASLLSSTPAHGNAVREISYDLGDAAFRVDGFRNADLTGPQDIELKAVVHHPARVRPGTPLVVLSHGYRHTCADESYKWPCPSGVVSLPSYRGYDYLGRDLAARGFVVMSVSANGVNSGESGQAADDARAKLIGRHLEMWRDGAVPVPEAVRGAVDLTNVGTMGHSRGGRAVMWQASDNHAALVPDGVRIRAVVPLAPATYYAPDPEAPQNLDYRVTRIPFGAFTGTCDFSVRGGGPDYFQNARGRNTEGIHLFTVHGANHNFYNTVWSPSGGQPGAVDDAAHPSPGQCSTVSGGAERQLSEGEQRTLASRYFAAFFGKYLRGKPSPLLTESRPGVDVETA